MKTTRYLIIGGGMTGDAAAKGIREHDADGTIVLVGDDQHPPYKRPPLSKDLWSGGDEAKIWRHTDATGAELVLGRRIVALDLDARRATDDAGEEYAWEKLLLATGGSPRRLAGDDSHVVYFRTLDHFRALHERVGEGTRATVVGGGFIGSELAAALAGKGAKVTMLFPEPAIGFRLFPRDLADFVTLPVDNGIVVDEHGRVDGRDDVFAAGDVANFPSIVLGKRFRVEHEDHANTHGKVVGANMAGASIAYDHVPFFYSDLFDLGYEAVGEVDSRLEVESDWQEPFRKGTLTYLDGGRPRGFLFWNVWDKVDDGRARLVEAR